MPALDLAVQSGLFAFLFGLVVLLAIFEEPVRRVVVREIFRSFGFFYWIGLDTTIAGLELFQKLPVSFRSVLALGVILGPLLYTFAILHRPSILLITVRPYAAQIGRASCRERL